MRSVLSDLYPEPGPDTVQVTASLPSATPSRRPSTARSASVATERPSLGSRSLSFIRSGVNAVSSLFGGTRRSVELPRTRSAATHNRGTRRAVRPARPRTGSGTGVTSPRRAASIVSDGDSPRRPASREVLRGGGRGAESPTSRSTGHPAVQATDRPGQQSEEAAQQARPAGQQADQPGSQTNQESSREMGQPATQAGHATTQEEEAAQQADQAHQQVGFGQQAEQPIKQADNPNQQADRISQQSAQASHEEEQPAQRLDAGSVPQTEQTTDPARSDQHPDQPSNQEVEQSVDQTSTQFPEHTPNEMSDQQPHHGQGPATKDLSERLPDRDHTRGPQGVEDLDAEDRSVKSDETVYTDVETTDAEEERGSQVSEPFSSGPDEDEHSQREQGGDEDDSSDLGPRMSRRVTFDENAPETLVFTPEPSGAGRGSDDESSVATGSTDSDSEGAPGESFQRLLEMLRERSLTPVGRYSDEGETSDGMSVDPAGPVAKYLREQEGRSVLMDDDESDIQENEALPYRQERRPAFPNEPAPGQRRTSFEQTIDEFLHYLQAIAEDHKAHQEALTLLDEEPMPADGSDVASEAGDSAWSESSSEMADSVSESGSARTEVDSGLATSPPPQADEEADGQRVDGESTMVTDDKEAAASPGEQAGKAQDEVTRANDIELMAQASKPAAEKEKGSSDQSPISETIHVENGSSVASADKASAAATGPQEGESQVTDSLPPAARSSPPRSGDSSRESSAADSRRGSAILRSLLRASLPAVEVLGSHSDTDTLQERRASITAATAGELLPPSGDIQGRSPGQAGSLEMMAKSPGELSSRATPAVSGGASEAVSESDLHHQPVRSLASIADRLLRGDSDEETPRAVPSGVGHANSMAAISGQLLTDHSPGEPAYAAQRTAVDEADDETELHSIIMHGEEVQDADDKSDETGELEGKATDTTQAVLRKAGNDNDEIENTEINDKNVGHAGTLGEEAQSTEVRKAHSEEAEVQKVHIEVAQHEADEKREKNESHPKIGELKSREVKAEKGQYGETEEEDAKGTSDDEKLGEVKASKMRRDVEAEESRTADESHNGESSALNPQKEVIARGSQLTETEENVEKTKEAAENMEAKKKQNNNAHAKEAEPGELHNVENVTSRPENGEMAEIEIKTKETNNVDNIAEYEAKSGNVGSSVDAGNMESGKDDEEISTKTENEEMLTKKEGTEILKRENEANASANEENERKGDQDASGQRLNDAIAETMATKVSPEEAPDDVVSREGTQETITETGSSREERHAFRMKEDGGADMEQTETSKETEESTNETDGAPNIAIQTSTRLTLDIGGLGSVTSDISRQESYNLYSDEYASSSETGSDNSGTYAAERSKETQKDASPDAGSQLDDEKAHLEALALLDGEEINESSIQNTIRAFAQEEDVMAGLRGRDDAKGENADDQLDPDSALSSGSADGPKQSDSRSSLFSDLRSEVSVYTTGSEMDENDYGKNRVRLTSDGESATTFDDFESFESENIANLETLSDTTNARKLICSLIAMASGIAGQLQMSETKPKASRMDRPHLVKGDKIDDFSKAQLKEIYGPKIKAIVGQAKDRLRKNIPDNFQHPSPHEPEEALREWNETQDESKKGEEITGISKEELKEIHGPKVREILRAAENKYEETTHDEYLRQQDKPEGQSDNISDIIYDRIRKEAERTKLSLEQLKQYHDAVMKEVVKAAEDHVIAAAQKAIDIIKQTIIGEITETSGHEATGAEEIKHSSDNKEIEQTSEQINLPENTKGAYDQNLPVGLEHFQPDLQGNEIQFGLANKDGQNKSVCSSNEDVREEASDTKAHDKPFLLKNVFYELIPTQNFEAASLGNARIQSSENDLDELETPSSHDIAGTAVAITQSVLAEASDIVDDEQTAARRLRVRKFISYAKEDARVAEQQIRPSMDEEPGDIDAFNDTTPDETQETEAAPRDMQEEEVAETPQAKQADAPMDEGAAPPEDDMRRDEAPAEAPDDASAALPTTEQSPSVSSLSPSSEDSDAMLDEGQDTMDANRIRYETGEIADQAQNATSQAGITREMLDAEPEEDAVIVGTDVVGSDEVDEQTDVEARRDDDAGYTETDTAERTDSAAIQPDSGVEADVDTAPSPPPKDADAPVSGEGPVGESKIDDDLEAPDADEMEPLVEDRIILNDTEVKVSVMHVEPSFVAVDDDMLDMPTHDESNALLPTMSLRTKSSILAKDIVAPSLLAMQLSGSTVQEREAFAEDMARQTTFYPEDGKKKDVEDADDILDQYAEDMEIESSEETDRVTTESEYTSSSKETLKDESEADNKDNVFDWLRRVSTQMDEMGITDQLKEMYGEDIVKPIVMAPAEEEVEEEEAPQELPEMVSPKTVHSDIGMYHESSLSLDTAYRVRQSSTQTDVKDTEADGAEGGPKEQSGDDRMKPCGSCPCCLAIKKVVSGGEGVPEGGTRRRSLTPKQRQQQQEQPQQRRPWTSPTRSVGDLLDDASSTTVSSTCSTSSVDGGDLYARRLKHPKRWLKQATDEFMRRECIRQVVLKNDLVSDGRIQTKVTRISRHPSSMTDCLEATRDRVFPGQSLQMEISKGETVVGGRTVNYQDVKIRTPKSCSGLSVRSSPRVRSSRPGAQNDDISKRFIDTYLEQSRAGSQSARTSRGGKETKTRKKITIKTDCRK